MTAAIAERVGDDDAVEADLLAARQLLDVQRAEQPQRRIADQQADRRPTTSVSSDALGDELPRDAPAAGAERQARRQLLQPRARPHERRGSRR